MEHSLDHAESDTSLRSLVARYPFEASLAVSRARLYEAALKLTQHPSSADDLVQETLVRALSAHKYFRPEFGPDAWLHRILINLHSDWRRKLNTERKLLMKLELLVEDQSLLLESSTAIDPLDLISSSDLHAAIELLSSPIKEVVLASWQGESYGAIASRFGISIGTVGTRLHRAKLKLRESLMKSIAVRQARTPAPRERRNMVGRHNQVQLVPSAAGSMHTDGNDRSATRGDHSE